MQFMQEMQIMNSVWKVFDFRDFLIYVIAFLVDEINEFLSIRIFFEHDCFFNLYALKL